MIKPVLFKNLIKIRQLRTLIYFDIEKDLDYDASVTYTDHPTSIGTPISDHKYKNFKKESISGRIQNISFKNSSNFAKDNRIRELVRILEDCMYRGIPVDVSSRFFTQKNVYIKSVHCNIPSDSINTADFNIEFTEVITASIKATKIDGYTPQNVGSNDIDKTVANKEVINTILPPTQLKDQPLISYKPFESKQDLSYNLPYISKISSCIESTVGKEKTEERYIQNWSNPLNWG